MKTISVGLILAALLPGAFAQTNAPAARSLSLQDCLTEALKHNFDVQVENYEPQIAALNLKAAYAGYDPTFKLSGNHTHDRFGGLLTTTNGLGYSDNNQFDSSLGGSLPTGTKYSLDGTVTKSYAGNDSAGGQALLTVTQPLLKDFWIDGTRLKISGFKNALKVSEQGLRQQLITTVTAVEEAYYELIFARGSVQVQQEALELAQKQLSDDRQRVQIQVLAERGGTIEQDEAQVAQSRANLIAAQFTLSSDENTLKNLITDNYLQWHDVTIQPSETLEAVRQFLDVQESWSKGMALRPDLIKSRLKLEQQGIQLKYDWNQLFPQLDISGSYGYNGAGAGFNDTFDQVGTANRPQYSYGGSLSVPLSNVGARNSYQADQATEKQFLLTLKQLEQSAMVEIDDAVKQVQSAWESLDATRKLRIAAEAALSAEQGKYSVGKSTTFTVLQLQNQLTSARSQEIRSLADYNKALSELSKKEGTTLERRKLDVQVKK